MYPLEIPGITGPSMGNFTFNGKADEQTMLRLVGGIPPEIEVTFYDEAYRSSSEGGAYVTFRRYNDQDIMRRGNHGWSTNWEPVTVEGLVGYLSKCSKYNMGPSFPNTMYAHPAVKAPSVIETPGEAPSLQEEKTKWWQFWRQNAG